jgi:capsular exopolysaccharide synthesis family protein
MPGEMGTLTALHAQPPGMSSTPNATALLKALRRRWLLATGLGLIGAGIVAAAAWFLVPIKYRATGTIVISSNPAGPLDEGTGARDPASFLIFQKSQAAQVKSRWVLTAALRNPKVADLPLVKEQSDSIEWLQLNLVTDFTRSAEWMGLSLSGEKPEELVLLLNAILDAYNDEVIQSDNNARLDRIQRLKDLSTKYEERLRSARRTYKELAEATGVINQVSVALKQQFAMDALQAQKNELLATQSQIRKKKLDILVGRSQDKEGFEPAIPEAAITKELNADKVNATLMADIMTLEQMKEKSEPYHKGAEGEAYMRTKYVEPIEAKKKQLKQRMDEMRTQIVRELRREVRIASKDSVAKDEQSLTMLEEMEKRLQADVNKQTESMKRDTGNNLDVEAQKDEMDKLADMARQLRQLIEKATLEINSGSRVRIGERADVRQGQAERRQILITAGCAAGALIIILFSVAYWEFRARKIATGEDVISGLGWRLVGALPALPNRSSGRSVSRKGDDKYWHSILTESVDATRTVLLHAARTEGLRTVMVTSAVAGEGKTSLSCHLATSLARAGRKTVLIDCDLRSPAAHRLFELPCDPGLSELLRGEVDYPDVIRATPANNLWLVPAGQVDAQTLQVLSQDGLLPVFERLKEQFDFLVVDSSPVLPVADTMTIGQNVDVVIFSLLRDVSRMPNVYAAYQRLASLGIRMLGAVVNGVDKGAYGYAYQYYAKQEAQ